VGAQLYAHNAFNKTNHHSSEYGTLKYEASFAFGNHYSSSGVQQDESKIIIVLEMRGITKRNASFSAKDREKL
jgi:hypothetical protein